MADGREAVARGRSVAPGAPETAASAAGPPMEESSSSGERLAREASGGGGLTGPRDCVVG